LGRLYKSSSLTANFRWDRNTKNRFFNAEAGLYILKMMVYINYRKQRLPVVPASLTRDKGLAGFKGGIAEKEGSYEQRHEILWTSPRGFADEGGTAHPQSPRRRRHQINHGATWL
jgi:hypothetical protein